MKHDIPFRITVINPLAGVSMRVQCGKSELLNPLVAEDDRLVFEFSVSVDLSNSTPNFLGKYAQGPKDARFVYVNSGSYAGQHGTQWNRRAKLSLMSISKKDIEELQTRPESRFETSIDGVGRDGGPVCASVKGIEWRIADR